MARQLRNDRRTIFGWAMYDWANSAYSTTIAGALLPAYFADEVVPDGGYHVFGRAFSGETIWGLVVGIGAFVLFLASPLLGAVADFSAAKKRFLRVFAYGGAIFTILLFFMQTGDVVPTLALFLIAQFGFVGANVFYDGFLPEITTPDTIDRVSARGFALGYVGGGLQLAIVALLILFAEDLGMADVTAARIGLAMAGVWWLGFSAFAFSRIQEAGEPQQLPERYRRAWHPLALARIGMGRTVATARRLTHFRQLLLFVIAFMLYNDGVQTVIAMTSVYAKDTLELETETILAAFLVVQLVAFFGALWFGRLAGTLGTRGAILASLVVWGGVSIAAYFLPAGNALPFFGLAMVVGVVLGGVQALSRSLYGSMIPEAASAEFFGFFSVFEKFSAIWGPLVFAVVSHTTGSARNSILSIIGFFLVGGFLLWRVDIDEARASRLRWSFEAEAVRVD